MIRQLTIKHLKVGSETDSRQKRISYEVEKEKLNDLLHTNLNIQGISWLSNGEISLVCDNTVGEIQSFLRTQTNMIVRPDNGHIVLPDDNGNDLVTERLEQNPDKPQVTLRVK